MCLLYFVPDLVNNGTDNDNSDNNEEDERMCGVYLVFVYCSLYFVMYGREDVDRTCYRCF